MRNRFAITFEVIEVCERYVPTEFRPRSSISKSEVLALLGTTIKSAKKLMGERQRRRVGSMFSCC